MNLAEWRNEAVSQRLNYFFHHHLVVPEWIMRRNEELFIEWLLTVRTDFSKILTGKE